jgi:hypothetical protein
MLRGDFFDHGQTSMLCTVQTHYASREAQKAQWRVHSRTCRFVDEPEARGIAALSLPQVMSTLQRSLQTGGDATTSLLMARLRTLLDEGADEDDDVEMQIHQLGRSLIFHGDDAFFLQLWAAPGMASLLLMDEWLLTDVARKQKHWFPLGLPVEEAHLDLEDTARGAAETLSRYDPSDMRSGAFKFCYLYYNIIVGSALQGSQTMSSINDGRGRLRAGAFAVPALKRALDLWACPFVRLCCGDAMAPAASLAGTMVAARINLSTYKSPLHAIELDIGGLISAALDESENGAAGKHAVGFLGSVQDDARGGFWARCDGRSALFSAMLPPVVSSPPNSVAVATPLASPNTPIRSCGIAVPSHSTIIARNIPTRHMTTHQMPRDGPQVLCAS